MKSNLPEDWRRRKIKEICKVTSGKRPLTVSSQKSSNNSIPIYGGAGIMGYTNEALFKGPILVTGRVGTLGLLHKSTSPCWPSDNTLVIIPRKEEDLGFIYYALKMKMSNILALNRGTSNPLVTQRDIEELEIYEPELQQEKAKISEILGSLEDKIELNYEMNKTLEAIAQAIFKNWFVDFEPFKDKLVYNEELDKEIPKGWHVVKLAEICEINMGQSPPSNTYNEVGKGLSFFQGIKDFGFRYPTPSVYCSAPRKIAKPGDILFSVRAPIGELNLTLEDSCIGRGIAALRYKFGSNNFLFYLLKKSKRYWKHTHEGGGTVFGDVTKEDLENFELLFPGNDIVEKFNSIIGPFDMLIKINEEESRILTMLRDTLLPKLLSGEIRVKIDVEKEFPEETKKLKEIREEKIKLQESLEKWFK